MTSHLGLLILFAVFVSLIFAVLMRDDPKEQQMFGLRLFSIEFLNEYWLHFELVSVLLVAAVVAALAVLEVGRRRRG